jgi:hypothetical protein
MRLSLVTLLFLASCSVLAMPVFSAELPGAERPRADWITLGFGAGDLGQAESHENLLFNEMAFLVSANALRDSKIWSVRVTRLASDTVGGDLALLCDRVITRGDLLVSAGVGPALVYRNRIVSDEGPLCCALKSSSDDDDLTPIIGLAWSAQALFGERTGSGFGLQSFGGIADRRSFWALALVFRLGDRPTAGEQR